VLSIRTKKTAEGEQDAGQNKHGGAGGYDSCYGLSRDPSSFAGVDKARPGSEAPSGIVA